MEWGLHKLAGQGHHFRKDWSPELERRRAEAGGAAGRFPGAVLTPDTQLRGPCVHCPEWRAVTGPRALKSRGKRVRRHLLQGPRVPRPGEQAQGQGNAFQSRTLLNFSDL